MKEVDKYYLITRDYEYSDLHEKIVPLLKVIEVFDSKKEARYYIKKEQLREDVVYIKKFPEIE